VKLDIFHCIKEADKDFEVGFFSKRGDCKNLVRRQTQPTFGDKALFPRGNNSLKINLEKNLM